MDESSGVSSTSDDGAGSDESGGEAGGDADWLDVAVRPSGSDSGDTTFKVGKSREAFQEEGESTEGKDGGEAHPPNHPVVEVIKRSISVEFGEDTGPARWLVSGSITNVVGVNNTGGPGGEFSSGVIEIILDSEAEVPGEDARDEDGADGETVRVEEVFLGEERGVLFGGDGRFDGAEDGQDREDTNSPDSGLEDTPDGGQFLLEEGDLTGQGVGFEFVASSGAADSDSGSAVKDEFVLESVGDVGSLENSLEGGIFAGVGRSTDTFAHSDFESGFVLRDPRIIVLFISELGVFDISTVGTASTGGVLVDEWPGGFGVGTVGFVVGVPIPAWVDGGVGFGSGSTEGDFEVDQEGVGVEEVVLLGGRELGLGAEDVMSNSSTGRFVDLVAPFDFGGTFLHIGLSETESGTVTSVVQQSIRNETLFDLFGKSESTFIGGSDGSSSDIFACTGLDDGRVSKGTHWAISVFVSGVSEFGVDGGIGRSGGFGGDGESLGGNSSRLISNKDDAVARGTLEAGLPVGLIFGVDFSEVDTFGGGLGLSEESEETTGGTFSGDNVLGGGGLIGLDAEFVTLPDVGLGVKSGGSTGERLGSGGNNLFGESGGLGGWDGTDLVDRFGSDGRVKITSFGTRPVEKLVFFPGGFAWGVTGGGGFDRFDGGDTISLGSVSVPVVVLGGTLDKGDLSESVGVGAGLVSGSAPEEHNEAAHGKCEGDFQNISEDLSLGGGTGIGGSNEST